MLTPTPSESVDPNTMRIFPLFIASATSLRLSLLVEPSTRAICSRGTPACTSRSIMSCTVENAG